MKLWHHKLHQILYSIHYSSLLITKFGFKPYWLEYVREINGINLKIINCIKHTLKGQIFKTSESIL